MTRLLVPVDFSPVTEPLIDVAASIAERYAAELVLMHVIEETLVEHVIGGYNVSIMVSQLVEESRGKLDVLRKRAEASGARVMVYDDVPVADPAVAIAEAASEVRASEVIVASRGWGVKRLFSLGSTSRLVVKLSPVPVFFLRAVKEGDEVRILTREGSLFGTIVYGVTSGYREEALDYISKLAAKTKSRLVLVTVREEGGMDTLKTVEQKLIYRGIEVERVEASGSPHEEILAYAEAVGANSIFLERRVHEGIKALFLGSTLDRILNSSRVPVIVHPAAGEQVR